MTWTRYIPEAAGLTFIFAVIVSSARGFLAKPQRVASPPEDDEESPEDAMEVAYALERERYEAIVSELADCPERRPTWAREHHRERAVEMFAGSNAVGIRGQMLWESGQELRGLLAVDDANRMRQRAFEMLAEVDDR